MANPAPNSPNARGRKAARAETPHEAPIAAPATTDEQIEERLEEQAAAAPVEAEEASDEVADSTEAAASPEQTAEAAAEAEKQRIREQLEALHRREVELRRELVIADHPELRGSFRALAKAAGSVAAIDAKVANGLSKSDARRKATIEKQHATLLARRAEIDARLAELDAEISALGEARIKEFQSERRASLLALGALLVEHGPAIAAAGLDLTTLIPGLPGWREEILALGPTLEHGEPS